MLQKGVTALQQTAENGDFVTENTVTVTENCNGKTPDEQLSVTGNRDAKHSYIDKKREIVGGGLRARKRYAVTGTEKR